MKIELDLDYNSALFIRACISKHLDAEYSTDLITALDDAIADEDEGRGVEHAERLMESGGTGAVYTVYNVAEMVGMGWLPTTARPRKLRAEIDLKIKSESERDGRDRCLRCRDAAGVP